MDGLAASTGIAEPALRLLVSLLASYPLSAAYGVFCQTPTQKHLFGAIGQRRLRHDFVFGCLNSAFLFLAGFALIFFNYGFDVYHAVLTTFVRYKQHSVSSSLFRAFVQRFEFSTQKRQIVQVTWLLISFIPDRSMSLVISFIFNFGYLLVGYVFTVSSRSIVVSLSD
jgi:hypothetical protein